MKLRIDPEKEYGIVLEGGGARGAYQIGVWKALREAGVKIRGVAGTSVGALNGALICMDDLEKAEEIWGNMTYSAVFNVDDSMIGKLKRFGVRSMKVSDAAAEFRRLFSDRGLDIAPLKKLLEETVDEERIRRSPRDFCAASFSVTDRREEDFDVKAAPPGAMKNILLASAYFPGFKQEKLGGKTYLDGGSVNNVPLDLLADRGYKDLIVIRLYGIGVDRRRFMDIPADVTVYEIAPRRNLGGILEFDSARTRKNMRLGYFDGLRFLYGLYGRKYYLDMPYSEAYYFGRIMSELDMFKEWLRPYVKEEEFEKLTGYRAYTEKIFPFLAKKLRLHAEWDYRELYGAILEVFAKKMQLEVFKVYTPDEIVGKIHELLSDKLTIKQESGSGAGKAGVEIPVGGRRSSRKDSGEAADVTENVRRTLKYGGKQ